MNDALLQALDEYQQRWPAEAAMVARVRGLVAAHQDCFHRTCLPGHVTGSAWVLSPDRRRCLLLHHRKLGKWLQPGGHADGDTDVLRVAMREVCEESGLGAVYPLLEGRPLDVDVHRIPARTDASGNITEPAHDHHDLRFLLTTNEPTDLAVSDESHDVRWCTTDEIHQLTQEASVLRLLEKSQAWMRA